MPLFYEFEFDVSVTIQFSTTILKDISIIMASSRKKSKFEFQSEWTNSFLFVEVLNGAYCLLCPANQKLFEVFTKFNFERHLKAKHADIASTSLESRSKLANELIDELEGAKYEEVLSIMEAKCKMQKVNQNIIISSYVLAFEIAKNSKPFEEGDFIKKCFGIASSYICPDMKQNFEQIALSSRSVCRRIDSIHDYLNDKLKLLIKDAAYYSIAMDESTDIKDLAQLCIFIRGINKSFEIFEELLSVQPMIGRTTGKDFLEEFKNCQNKYEMEF